MKAINQTSNLVNMNSLGKSHENREQYLLKVWLLATITITASTKKSIYGKIM